MRQYSPEQLREVLAKARDDSPLGEYPENFDEGFEIRDTPNHGGDTSRGVFAVRRIRKDAVLGEYRGVISQGRLQASIADAKYQLKIDRTPYSITAADPQTSSWPRMINRPNRNETSNVKFEAWQNPDDTSDYNYRVLIVAIRAIPANRQILATYRE